MFWFINNFSTVKYSIRKRVNLKRGTIINKFRRSGSKKIVKKTRSTSLLRIIKLNFLFNNFTNTPPLSTILNLIGVNVQKFCEDLNKELLGLFSFNILIKLKIIIFRNLSYNYVLDVNNNFLVKNSLFMQSQTANVFYLNYVVDRIVLSSDRFNVFSLLNKVFVNTYLFQSVLLLHYLKIYIFRFICHRAVLSSFFHLDSIFLPFETIIRNNYSIIKSFNLKLLNIGLKKD